MKGKVVGYGILTAAGIGLLYQLIPIGDYCGGLLTALTSMVFGGILLVAFLIITTIGLFRILHSKARFDIIPLLLFVFFCLGYYFITEQKNKKFWTKQILTGMVEEIYGTAKSGWIDLYENGTFAATVHSADYSCTFQGQYAWQNNHLELDRPGLEELTSYVFCTQYSLHKSDSTLLPISLKFPVIKVRTFPFSPIPSLHWK